MVFFHNRQRERERNTFPFTGTKPKVNQSTMSLRPLNIETENSSSMSFNDYELLLQIEMSWKIKLCWNTLHASIFSFEKFTSDWLIFSCSISPEGIKCRQGAFRAMRIKERQTYEWGKNMLFCSSIQRLQINPWSALAAVY